MRTLSPSTLTAVTSLEAAVLARETFADPSLLGEAGFCGLRVADGRFSRDEAPCFSSIVRSIRCRAS